VHVFPGIEKGLLPVGAIELEFLKEIGAVNGPQVFAFQNQFPLSKEMIQRETEPVQWPGIATNRKEPAPKTQEKVPEFLFQFEGGWFAYLFGRPRVPIQAIAESFAQPGLEESVAAQTVQSPDHRPPGAKLQIEIEAPKRFEKLRDSGPAVVARDGKLEIEDNMGLAVVMEIRINPNTIDPPEF
jgi:hypothetical protein